MAAKSSGSSLPGWVWQGVYIVIAFVVGVFFLLPLAAYGICKASYGTVGCQYAEYVGKSAPATTDTPRFVGATPDGDLLPGPRGEVRRGPVDRGSEGRRYDGRRAPAERPRVVKRVRRDDASTRGPAEKYCMDKNPHWKGIMEEYEGRCEITANHGSGATNCSINC